MQEVVVHFGITSFAVGLDENWSPIVVMCAACHHRVSAHRARYGMVHMFIVYSCRAGASGRVKGRDHAVCAVAKPLFNKLNWGWKLPDLYLPQYMRCIV